MVPRKSASYRLPIGFTLSCSYGENLVLAGFAIRNPTPVGFLKSKSGTALLMSHKSWDSTWSHEVICKKTLQSNPSDSILLQTFQTSLKSTVVHHRRPQCICDLFCLMCTKDKNYVWGNSILWCWTFCLMWFSLFVLSLTNTGFIVTFSSSRSTEIKQSFNITTRR